MVRPASSVWDAVDCAKLLPPDDEALDEEEEALDPERPEDLDEAQVAPVR